MPRRRPDSDREAVAALLELDLTHRQVSERTGVPICTIRTWLKRGAHARRPLCSACRGPVHAFDTLPPAVYSYLLAVYLGDGWLERVGVGWRLKIAQDVQYPAILEEMRTAILHLRGRWPHAVLQSRKNYVTITSNWKQWPCLLPQHGPGRKHHRRIELTDWQWELVRAAPEAFLRGLIHTDGWRGMNRVRVKGKDYAYPRYQFSNRSDDIRRLFCDVCDLMGIEWRPWGRWHVSVARKASVARLDEFIGPKR